MTVANLLGALDGPDLLIILLIVLLLFGGTKLPHLARSLGQAKREFHDATTNAAPAGTPGDDAESTSSVTITRGELDRLRTAAHDSARRTDPDSN